MQRPPEVIGNCSKCGIAVLVENGVIAQHKRRAGVGLFDCEGALRPPAKDEAPKGKKRK